MKLRFGSKPNLGKKRSRIVRAAVAAAMPSLLIGGYAVAQRPMWITSITETSPSPDMAFYIATISGLTAYDVYEAYSNTSDSDAVKIGTDVDFSSGGNYVTGYWEDVGVQYTFFLGDPDPGTHCAWQGCNTTE